MISLFILHVNGVIITNQIEKQIAGYENTLLWFFVRPIKSTEVFPLPQRGEINAVCERFVRGAVNGGGHKC